MLTHRRRVVPLDEVRGVLAVLELISAGQAGAMRTSEATAAMTLPQRSMCSSPPTSGERMTLCPMRNAAPVESMADDFPVTLQTAGMPASFSAIAGPCPSVKMTVSIPSRVALPPCS